MALEHSTSRELAAADHMLSLVRWLRLTWLLDHFPARLARSGYVFVNAFVTVGLVALLTLVSRNPFVFPPLGPTAYLLFFSPLSTTSSPRNTILSHTMGIVCGYAAFVLAGVGALPLGAHADIYWPRILAAALSLSATGALMVLLDLNHPPAGATALIISLGIISTLRELAVIEGAVFLLVAQAWVINRLAGIPYPLWSATRLKETANEAQTG